MWHKVFLILILFSMMISSTLASNINDDLSSENKITSLKISDLSSSVKYDFSEILLSALKEETDNSIATYIVDSSDSFVGAVISIRLPGMPQLFVPLLSSQDASNPMWSVELFMMISEYTGIRSFMIYSDYFENELFSKYAEGYISLEEKISEALVRVKVKPYLLPTRYKIYSLDFLSNTNLKLLTSILTDGLQDLPSMLKSIYRLKIDYTRYYNTFVEKRAQLLDSLDLDYESPSLFDYLEASTYLPEDILTKSSSLPSKVIKTSSSHIYPISAFYIDLIKNNLVSIYNTYAIFFNKFFIEPPSIVFRAKHNLGLEILNQMFYELSAKDALELKNAMVLLHGPSLSIIILDTLSMYFSIFSTCEECTTGNLFEETDILNEESCLDFLESRLDPYAIAKIQSFLTPRHLTLNLILHNPDSISLIWIASTLEAIARATSFNVLDIYNLVTFLSILEKNSLPELTNSDVLNLYASFDYITQNLSSKFIDNSVEIPSSLKQLIHRIELYQKKLLESGSDSDKSLGCRQLFKKY